MKIVLGKTDCFSSKNIFHTNKFVKAAMEKYCRNFGKVI